jgi:beta-glucosidase
MGPQARQGVLLELRYRVDEPPTEPVQIGLRCTQPLCGTRTGAMLDVTRELKTAPPGMWRTLSVPLSCFSAAGADLGSVVAPLAVQTSGRFSLTISEVRLAPKNAGPEPRCPGAGAI